MGGRGRREGGRGPTGMSSYAEVVAITSNVNMSIGIKIPFEQWS